MASDSIHGETDRKQVEVAARELQAALCDAGANHVARLVRIYTTVMGRPVIEFMPLQPAEVAELTEVIRRCPAPATSEVGGERAS